MGLFKNLFGHKTPVKYAITAKNNPYRSRIYWPPNFAELPHTAQFRFEKKYRRRAKLKHMNPTWIKSVKIFQWVACTGFAVYAILFYDWPLEENYVGEPPFWTVWLSYCHDCGDTNGFCRLASGYSENMLPSGRLRHQAGFLHL